MVRLAASRVRQDFAETLNEVVYRGERVVLQRRGKNLAAIVPMADLELLEELEDRIDLEAARKSLRGRGKNIPFAKIKAELGL